MITFLQKLLQCLLLTEAIELSIAFLTKQFFIKKNAGTDTSAPYSIKKENAGAFSLHYCTGNFLFHKKGDVRQIFLLLFPVNLLTNPLANLLYSFVCFYGPHSCHTEVWLLIEAGVVWTEGWIFSRFCPRLQRPWLFSLTLNLISALFPRFL